MAPPPGAGVFADIRNTMMWDAVFRKPGNEHILMSFLNALAEEDANGNKKCLTDIDWLTPEEDPIVLQKKLLVFRGVYDHDENNKKLVVVSLQDDIVTVF
jgi:hypothetical protein